MPTSFQPLLNNIRLSGHEVSPCCLNLSKKRQLQEQYIWGEGDAHQLFHLVKMWGRINPISSCLTRVVWIFQILSLFPPKRFLFPSPFMQSWQQDCLSFFCDSYSSHNTNFTLALRVHLPLLNLLVHTDPAQSETCLLKSAEGLLSETFPPFQGRPLNVNLFRSDETESWNYVPDLLACSFCWPVPLATFFPTVFNILKDKLSLEETL